MAKDAGSNFVARYDRMPKININGCNISNLRLVIWREISALKPDVILTKIFWVTGIFCLITAIEFRGVTPIADRSSGVVFERSRSSINNMFRLFSTWVWHKPLRGFSLMLNTATLDWQFLQTVLHIPQLQVYAIRIFKTSSGLLNWHKKSSLDSPLRPPDFCILAVREPLCSIGFLQKSTMAKWCCV